ncbi:mannose-1-phosphate guanylyltransferase [Pedobacter zeae]|uniref:mannose-1-phosphate guanylyltransferase n=1 Tax=Pedobacter zeae TaxID=1737356 RepID=A0A7W6KDM4_9SPHI|nr:mannose-1-phosphate guanylyltransferase [Pedobacter zeae]MBB4109856.1 mannose-1-phosphate guanylyltransferase [Pedobacter zeae]GGH14594.1 mannose-1-phosphate guanylyltransferase [Pedobacter zeae]
MSKNTYVLIMAGGVGSRFWPKSRNHFPKQFIDILGIGKSLLQLTYERFLNICSNEQIFILTNETYADLVVEQLPAVLKPNILLEPSRNNTAPCIAYAIYKIGQLNPEANIVVAPSDHLILKEKVFLNKVEQALDFSSKHDALLTLGITPTRPDTGYGYIQYQESDSKSQAEIKKVSAFMEKPILTKAEEYLKSGDYVWNAGIFIWSVRSLKKAFEQYAPEIATLFESGLPFYNSPDEIKFISQNYPLSPNISIDYAILEKADNVYTIPADIGWSDLGTWASLHAVGEKDAANNMVNLDKINLKETSNCIIHLPKDKAAVIRGLENYIIVDDGEVLLIYPKSDEQEIKQVAKDMVAQHGIKYA